MLTWPKDANEIMVLVTSMASIFHEKKMKFHPQVSTNKNTIKYLNLILLHKNSKEC